MLKVSMNISMLEISTSYVTCIAAVIIVFAKQLSYYSSWSDHLIVALQSIMFILRNILTVMKL